MYTPPPAWQRAPVLLVDQTFDHGTDLITVDDSSATSLFLDSTTLYGPDISWCVQSSSGEGSGTSITRVNTPYRVGVYNISTNDATGEIVAVGLDLGVIGTTGNGSLITPLCPALAVNCYRWEWWVEITSIAGANYRVGLMDSSPLGSLATGAYMNFDTTVDANWHAINREASVSTDEDTGIAATTGWHKFVGERKPDEDDLMAWHYYIDGRLVRTIGTNMPLAPVTLIAAVRSRAALTSKSMSFDRAFLWTDGFDVVGGGTP